MLNELQSAIVNSRTQNLIVSASPGSGKTTTIVARAAKRLAEIKIRERIALITYTNAAADEILVKIGENDQLFIGTIHAFCLGFILKPFGWTLGFPQAKVVSYEQRKKFFELNTDINLAGNFGQNRFKELSKIRHNLDGSLNTDVEWDHQIALTEVADRYRAFLRSESVIEFEDILIRSYKILNKHDFVRKSLSVLFREIMVDEFQDTDEFQYQIMKMIHDIGSTTYIFVGDEKQRIFGFAGAINNAFNRAVKDFNAIDMPLTEVYRSTNEIVTCYCKLFLDHPKITNSSEFSNEEFSDIIFLETTNKNYNKSIITLLDNLINNIEVSPNEIAILSNSWFDSYNTSKLIRDKFPLCGQGALPHPGISNSAYQLFRSMIIFISKPSMNRMRVIRRNFTNHCLENDLVFTEKITYKKINRLINQVSQIEEEYPISNSLVKLKTIFNEGLGCIHPVFDEIKDLINEDEIDLWNYKKYTLALNNNEGIRNDTIHKVKGLEFEVVILNNMNENKIPRQKLLSRKDWVYQELSEENIANARTVFYVGCSRPRALLIVNHNWKPSLFVKEIK